MTELENYRRMKDRFFALDPNSPLTREQRQSFHGLNYFPENAALRLEVAVEPFSPIAEIELQTTHGEVQVYRRYARCSFQVDDQPAELTIYHGDQGFFLPFVDSLSGTETYPAGRYLEPEPLPDNHFRIDFNEAYNPYCAYNDQWSCPITPAENRLKVAIRAGEKMFHQ